MSKKRRMPERGTSSTRRARNARRERRALRFRLGVQDRRIGGERLLGRSSGWSSVRLRLGRPKPLAEAPCMRASSARPGWALSDRRSGAGRRADGPPGCSGRDRLVRTGQPKHRQLAPRRPDHLQADRDRPRPAGYIPEGRPCLPAGCRRQRHGHGSVPSWHPENGRWGWSACR